MNQLFYNIAGGIVHQIRREKRTKIPEVIVRGKRNIKQNRNWFYFKFSVESSSFILQQFNSLKFVSIIVSKYIIFPRANNGRSRKKKKKFLAKRFAHAISVHYRDFEHAYVH